MERLRAIANPDELDPSFSVPCRRCAGLLQEGNRFCLFCFEDQLAPVVTVGEARSKVALKDALAVGDEAPAPEGFDFVDTVQPDANEAGLIGIDPSLRDELQADDGKRHWAARFARPRHAAIGAVPVLVLLALVFPEFGRIGVDDRSTIARPQVPRVAVEPLQAPSVPHVEPPQPQAQLQPTPLPDARETFSALGLSEAAASRPPLPKESPQPVVSAPAASAAAAADEKTCSDTLAALGLCPQK